MPSTTAPLLFTEFLELPGRWDELGKTHGLTRKDFEWLQNVQLATQVLRSQQTPPMLAHRILLKAQGLETVNLAGSFSLSTTPDDHEVILYTPYGGIKKFDTVKTLTDWLEAELKLATENDDLLSLMSLAQRKTLVAADNISVVLEVIGGDVFEDQHASIRNCQSLNDQAMLDELSALPTLRALLDAVLDELLQPSFPGLDQRKAQVSFYSVMAADKTLQDSHEVRHWHGSMSLSDAVLHYYRHQHWPAGQQPEFSHPQTTNTGNDQQKWESAVKTASGKLVSLLSTKLQNHWDGASRDGASRRAFFSRAIAEKARADIWLKRESGIISSEQSQSLHTLFKPTANLPQGLTLETVRLWEYQANYIELAGSLMISHSNACLYTPTFGLQVLKDYEDLKATLLSKFRASGHEDELYGLLSLEERNRFLGFDRPHVTGEVISGSIFTTLFESIIGKQLQNMEYALQVLRHSDFAMDIHALFDKALDIRSMISKQLLALDAQGRWSTRPVLSGQQRPSIVRAESTAAFVKTLNDVNALISAEFAGQPLTSLALQRVYLEKLKPQLAHALCVGVRGEASQRALDLTLGEAERAIVATVFNPDQADRKTRRVNNGFRPDAYSLILECTGQDNVLPLANCLLMTERGGLDNQHSGRAIAWTPAAGLEVFGSLNAAKQTLSRYLLDPRKRLRLLENLTPSQRHFHQRYSLNSFRLIEGNVLHHLAQNSIDHFLAVCEHVRSLKLAEAKEQDALKKLTSSAIASHLRRATQVSKAVALRQSLPAWLGMAPLSEQQLHLELLEQYRNSVSDDKDYLHGIQTLASYVQERLTALLASRYTGTLPGPHQIEIAPELALAGPAQTLIEFALNHVNIAQGSGFKVASGTTTALPDGLNQTAVQQLLRSLNISSTYARKVTETLTGTSEDAISRKLRFVQQLPWQLLQHAHALKLQHRLSASAFDLISQVLDMPDAVARALVKDAHAIVRPLELIKTAGATAVKTLGLYLIGPGSGHEGPHILYAPYHAGAVFSEFDNEASVVAAINMPGPLQNLVIRRLPDDQQSTFSNLFKATLGQLSEITFASTPIGGNLLEQLYSDNTLLLTQMLGSQSKTTGQIDWEAAKNLFSSGIKIISGLLPGKLAYVQFLWQSFKDFKDSAEALQDHHWKRALEYFIAGTVQMVSVGRLSLEGSIVSEQVSAQTAERIPTETTVVDPQWSNIKPTEPSRTLLKPFEDSTVALKNLTRDKATGTYADPVSKLSYAPVAGKVYGVVKPDDAWQIGKNDDGPPLLATASGQLVLDPERHTVHFGKAMSKMVNEFVADLEVSQALNIEARGMANIRATHPAKGRQIVQAIDMARYYAFNSLHNLAQVRKHPQGTRLEGFFKSFFDTTVVDTNLLDKISNAIVPICKALVDPNEELLDSERFIVGSSRGGLQDTSAFVVEEDARKHVHFTEKFFNQQLDAYKPILTQPFDVNGHAQAAILIHEFAHLFSKAIDISYLEARRPFSDLIAPITGFGAATKKSQENFQREALSLATPNDVLFARWNAKLKTWVDLDSIPKFEHIGKAILKATASTKMADARIAFRNPKDASARADIILLNADSLSYLICQMGRQLDPVAVSTP
ncbi:hypothetical protein M1M11_00640 [Pseudomonas azerbaijanoccidens]|uniref:dermonecrotic toxin domain-containing protein n=1 Tax=Pseudomonas azerbaijanoccidentalis TaxID=2842347 RepID=UPI00200AD7D9|nr:DUF6543 domain-containing protein [Pseudomonas azerbaijanoccidentalis]MCK8663400.1 hypothetical protein [Pseudomonas azerbaijanoccidentalis]